MSGIGKTLGKVFKKVVKVVKKIALPVLAIAAVVLTGGAALGALPAMGSMLGSIGITGGLATTMVSAANAATFGALGAAVTGKNIIKGAVGGLITGGIAGGLGMPIPGLNKLPGATGALSSAGQIGSNLSTPITGAGGAAPSMGMDSLINGARAAVPGGLGGASTALPQIANAANYVTQSAPMLTAATSTAAPAAAAQGGGGLMGLLNRNPTLAGMAMQGIGGGLASAADAKERKRERNSYSGLTSLFSLPDDDENEGNALPDAGSYYKDAIYGRLKINGNKLGKG